MQNFTRYSDASVNKFLIGVSMQFNLSFEFIYIDIGTRYHIPNMKTCLVYHWNQNRKKPEHKCSSLQQRYLFIGLFDFKTLFNCVKYSTCLRTAIPAYCFNTVGSMFGVLFRLLIKHLILGCKTLTKYEKVSMSRWSLSTFPYIDKEETFLSWKLHIGMFRTF